MKYLDFIQFVDRYRTHILRGHAMYLHNRRFGQSVNTRTRQTDLLVIRLLEKILVGNVATKLTAPIVLPVWIDQPSFNRLVILIKTQYA